jgi:hypothetical protein
VNIALKTGLCAAFITLGAGCGKSDRPAESAMAAESATTEGGSATESIAEARCARESRCDNVGADKKYSSMEDCIIRIRADWKDELSTRECKSGVNETALNACLSSVREEECSSPFDTLERVQACTTGKICAD